MNSLFLWYPKCSTCQKAKKWLDENNIKYKADSVVDNIMNNTNDDICPLEKRVKYIDGPYEAFRLIQGL